MIITRRLNLDIGKPGQQDAMYARRGDTRIYCVLAAFRDGAEEVTIPASASVLLTSTKPDGTVLTLEGKPENGCAKVYLSVQALTAAGIVTNQLRIINPDGSDLYSPSFDVIVEDGVLPEDVVLSSSDFNALTLLYQQVRGLIERTSLSVMGVPYETVEALHEAVPEPYPWSMYAVGASAPYDLYRYVGDENTGYHGWVNHGPIAGIVGPVFIPSVDEHGVISYTNNGGLANPNPVDLVEAAALEGKFLKYDTAQEFNEDQQKIIVGNIGALTYWVQALTDPQKIQSAANIGALSLLTQALSDAEKTQVAKNAGVLSFLPQDINDAQRDGGRTNLRLYEQLYTNTSQIGITLDTATTLEQIAAKLPNRSRLIITPPSSTTTNISPQYDRYGYLCMERLDQTRISVHYYAINNTTSHWANFINSNDGGVTWTVKGWVRTTKQSQHNTAIVTVATGSTAGTFAVQFSPYFAVPPYVSLTLRSSAPGAYSGIFYSVQNDPTVSGFTIVVNLGQAPISTPASIAIGWQADEPL